MSKLNEQTDIENQSQNVTDTERHLGIGKEYDFNGEKHIVTPLGTRYFGHITRIMNAGQKRFKGKQPKPEEMMSLFAEDKELMNDLVDMIDATLIKMFPDPEVTDDEVDAFSSKNQFYLIAAVLEQNMPKINKEDMTKAQKILARQKFHDESVSKDKKSK